MTEEPRSRSLRDYASFELERKGYNRAQVDAFLAELDQAFVELETSVKERGDELAELQQEVERLKRESPVGRSDELLRRAELNAEQMLASSLTESQEIISNAEAIAMRIIANARAQSQEIASQPAGFGMLARVRTIAADIDRMKAEHAALMEDDPEQLEMLGDTVGSSVLATTDGPDSPTETTADVTEDAPAAEEKPAQPAAPQKQPATKKKPAAKAPTKPKAGPTKAATKKTAPSKSTTPTAHEPADTEAADAPPETVEVAPRIQLVQPPLQPKVAATVADSDDERNDDEVVADSKNFDWSVAREQVRPFDEAAPLDPLAVVDDDEDDIDDDAVDHEHLPTIMRRQGSRYERHSASLPKIGNEGESTLSDVAKVSRRRRRRTATRDDENR